MRLVQNWAGLRNIPDLAASGNAVVGPLAVTSGCIYKYNTSGPFASGQCIHGKAFMVHLPAVNVPSNNDAALPTGPVHTGHSLLP